MLDQEAMSEILQIPATFWYKISTGKVTSFSTNSRQTADAMKRDMNAKRADGLILRTTREQAEKDPAP